MATLSSTGRFAAGEACADNDILYGPYATTAAAHSALLNAEQNVVGRTVGIQTGNTIEEYWYQGGTTESHLVKKQSSEVEANPSGEATTPLNKIKIGETNYNIPQTDTSYLATKTELQQGLSGKQDTINDLSAIRSGATAGASALQPLQSGQYTENNFAALDANGGIKNSNCNEGTFIKGVKKGTETLTPVNGVVTVPSDIESAQASPLPANSNPTATIDSNHVLQLGIPRGADAVNPFKGYYPSTKPTGTFEDGDYIYAPDSINGSTTTIWYWDETLSTPNWSDSGKVIDPAALVEFANTSKAVAATKVVNDLITGGTTDILSAEQGVILARLIRSIFSYEAKQALITLLEHVAWVDDNGSLYINSLRNLLFELNVVEIRAEYTQSDTVWSDGVSTLNDLKQDLTVYAIFSDNSEIEISGYELSGTLTSGTSIITVTYEELTDTFNVAVTQYGSVTAYSKSSGNLIVSRGSSAYQGSVGLIAINEYLTHVNRKIAAVDYGITPYEDISGVPLSPLSYPIKVPVGATQVTAAITPNTASISIKLIFLVDGDYWDLPTKPQDQTHYINTTFQVGSATLDIAGAGYSGRSDTYILVYMKPSSNNWSDSDPTNVNITFS